MRKTIYTAIMWFCFILVVFLLYYFRESPLLKPFFDWASSAGVGAILGFLGFIVIGLTTYIWRVKERTTALEAHHFTNRDISKLFGDINQRMMKIKDKASKQNIDKAIAKRTFDLLLDAFGIIKIDDIKDIKEKLKLSVTEIPNPNTLTIEQVKEIVLRKFKENFKVNLPERNITVQDMVTIGKVLDGMKIGLSKFTERDKKYLRLSRQIQNIKGCYADVTLNSYIDNYLLSSFGLNSYSLYTTYSTKFDKHEAIPLIFPVLIQNDWENIAMQSEKITGDIIASIINRVKELEKLERQNDTKQKS